MKRIAVLGSTGSIGRSALSVIEHLPDWRVVGLAGGANVELLAQQANQFHAEVVAVADDNQISSLRSSLPVGVKIVGGVSGIEEVASLPQADIVLVAISGAAGLPATLAALNAGKPVALANKESLVMAGNIVTRLAREKNVPLLPVDSEHSAIFQCMAAGGASEVEKVMITASGGAFRDFPLKALDGVTPQQALAHPTWDMGRKITIDSATMMNKALEIVEAHWLFDLDVDRIEVLVHPQSIVHSMVAFCDGSVIAQLGLPDMRVPIQYALSYPERRPGQVPVPDFASMSRLEFLKPDLKRFPAIELGFRVVRENGTLGAVLNAANEVAVEEFLNERITFPMISEHVAKVMDEHKIVADPTLAEIMEADRWARETVRLNLNNKIESRTR